ncbi:MAG: ribose 5-phosphate isomerase B [Desulfomonile tiedjei]|uniref:Ribose 5-phosphate isomerase B n=1 Tax=Desulfomonile tiedjei TaxID=2358 RepID=A0A9D6Z0R1_9BACT|nr:ribose 5-phosphate isomerase B [Desulfomonile tiedjei]
MKPILMGSDHAGFPLKNLLMEALTSEGTPVLDVGCGDETSCDYPVFARELCERILSGQASRGILICGTGIGMSIAANRYHGIRAALCTTEFHARMSRAHNDSNVLIIGGRVTGSELALAILKVWMSTPFEGERHQRRIDLIEGC